MATIKAHVSAATFIRRFGFAPCTCYEKPVAALYYISTKNSNMWNSDKQEFQIKEITVECDICGSEKKFTEKDFREDLFDSDINCL